MSLNDAAGKPAKSVSGSWQSAEGMPVYCETSNQLTGSEGASGSVGGDVGSVGSVGSVGGDSGVGVVHDEKTNKKQIKTVNETVNRIKVLNLRLPVHKNPQTQINCYLLL